MKLKRIINIFGGPGVGKSTTAAGLFYKMKCLGYSVEYVPEYAKELVYENRMNVLTADQLYIFAKQHRKIYRLINSVEYIITDSPLLLSLTYSKQMDNIFDLELFSDLVANIISKYPNLDIFLKRSDDVVYDTSGRYQTEEEAMDIDDMIYKSLLQCSLNRCELFVDKNTIKNILDIVRKDE